MKKPKAYLNVLALKVNMRLKRQVVRNYPVVAFIEPNLFCNLHCPACPTGLNLKLRPTVSIDEGLFRAAIDEMGDYLFQLSMYNWGEPLLHKQTPEMIGYAKKKNIKVVMSTNLSLKLTDDYLERLILSGLDVLMVSLDGTTAETYSKYRRNGNFDLVRENIRRIQAIKRQLGKQTPKVVWQFLVFRHNEHQIAQAEAEYKEWGADEISVGPAIMPLEQYNDGFEPSTIPEYNMYHPENVVQLESKRQMGSGRTCSWLYGAFVLNPNGKVSPCCAVPSEQHDFGNFRAGDKFFDVWNNEKFRRARHLFVEWSRKSSSAQQTETAPTASHLIDGMSVMGARELSSNELICQKCPIPYLQNYTDPIIAEAAEEAVRSIMAGDGIRGLFNYFLMGAPAISDWLRRAKNSFSYRLRRPAAAKTS